MKCYLSEVRRFLATNKKNKWHHPHLAISPPPDLRYHFATHDTLRETIAAGMLYIEALPLSFFIFKSHYYGIEGTSFFLVRNALAVF